MLASDKRWGTANGGGPPEAVPSVPHKGKSQGRSGGRYNGCPSGGMDSIADGVSQLLGLVDNSWAEDAEERKEETKDKINRTK